MQLRIPFDDTIPLLLTIPNDLINEKKDTKWTPHYNSPNGNNGIYGEMRAQAVCWLYCWTMTGMNSIEQNLGFTHAENKNKKKRIYLFTNNSYSRYPDFYKDNFILDAKYKRLNNNEIDRDDIHQIISYMYVQKAKLGGFIHPLEYKPTENPISKGTLNGYNGEIKIWGLEIPQNISNFNDFKYEMKASENKLAEKLVFLVNPIVTGLN